MAQNHHAVSSFRANAGFWLVFSLFAIVIVLRALPDGGTIITFDNDNAMRLVQVRDLLAGQGWYDLTQYRMGPDGVVMHWSRLVDGPIAFLIYVFSAFLNQSQAEWLTMIVWPVLLLGVFMWLFGVAGRRVSGRTGGIVATTLAGIMALTGGKFVPGAFDHHNLQLVLLAWMIAEMAGDARGTSGMLRAGFAAALSLGVGIEQLYLVVAVFVAITASWVFRAERTADGLVAFSLGFGAMLSLIFATTVAPEMYFKGYCDTLGTDLHLPAVTGAVALVAVAKMLANISLGLRLLGAIVAAGAAFTVAVLIASECLSAPYHDLDPLILEQWLAHIGEVEPFLPRLLGAPELYAGDVVVGLIAAISLGLWTRREPASLIVAVSIAVFAASLIVTLYQVRGIYAFQAACILPVALLVSQRYDAYVRAGRKALLGASVLLIGVLGNQGTWLIAAPKLSALTGHPSGAPSGSTVAPPNEFDRLACSDPENYAALAQSEPGLVASSDIIAEDILRATKEHRVLTAPYHRNQTGLLAQIRYELLEPIEALKELERYDVGYFVVCRSDPTFERVLSTGRNTLYRAIADGKAPAFLIPLATSGPVEIFSVQTDSESSQ